MKSLFKPEQPMRQSELFGIILAPAVWLLWILFLNGTARLPEGGFAGLLTCGNSVLCRFPVAVSRNAPPNSESRRFSACAFSADSCGNCRYAFRDVPTV